MIRIVPVALSFVVLLLAPPFAQAKVVEIENSRIKVAVGTDPVGFEIGDPQSGKTFVKSEGFAASIDSLQKQDVSDAIWGDGKEIVAAWKQGGKTSFRLFGDSPFVQIRTTIAADEKAPFVTAGRELFRVAVDLGLPPEKLTSYGTGFLSSLDDPVTSFSFTALADPMSRAGVVAAQLTHDLGSSVFTTEVTDGKPTIGCRLDFGRFEVAPGKSRETDIMLVGYFDDARLGLEAYADAVAKHYKIKLKPKPSVYCTWYHARASNEEKFYQNAEFVAKNLEPFGFNVMQIDDGWQELRPSSVPAETKAEGRGPGPVKSFAEANKNFPRGMAFTAERTDELGLVAGIWFMPFAGDYRSAYFADKRDLFAHWPDGTPIEDVRWSGTLLDMTNPDTEKFVFDRTKRIYDWGYRYFKLDGMHTGAVTHNVYVNTDWTSGGYKNTENFIGTQKAPGKSASTMPSAGLFDPHKTHIEAYRMGMDTVRRAAPDAFILGCNVSQNMRSMGAAFDKIDGMRIGPDNGSAGRGSWGAVVKGPHHGSNLYFLNNRVWHNDPDPVYVRASNPLESARWMVSWVAVTGSMITTSYQFAELPPERLDLVKRMVPSHSLKPRPVDCLENSKPEIWLLTDTRRNVRRDVIGLFNWDQNQPTTIEHTMERIGLDAEKPYVAFDFWADRFVDGPIQGTLKQTLPGGTCRILAVRPAADHPQLVSTSRHITQGVIDVLEETWNGATKTLSGKSQVVGDDPYELRIALPSAGKWRAVRCNAEGADIELGEPKKDEPGVRATIASKKNKTVSWTVAFEKE